MKIWHNQNRKQDSREESSGSNHTFITIWNSRIVQRELLVCACVSTQVPARSMPNQEWDQSHWSNTLETEFRKVGGASTYLQLVNMVKIQFTDVTDLLPQIQQFQDNYNRIMTNGHSRLSGDLATFMFCSSHPNSYELTTWQYLNNITVIANYKLMAIITRVLQEESRRKAQSLGQASSLNKFPTVKNLGQKCVKCGKINHTTQNHWPGGKHPNKGKGQKTQKASSSPGNK